MGLGKVKEKKADSSGQDGEPFNDEAEDASWLSLPDTLVIQPSRKSLQLNDDHQSGVINILDASSGLCSISLPSGCEEIVKLDCLANLTNNSVTIQKGQRVKVGTRKGGTRKGHVPVKIVVVAPIAREGWIPGFATLVSDEEFFFLKVEESPKDVYVHKAKLSKYSFPVKKGDCYQCQLGTRNPGKPVAINVKPLVLVRRTDIEVLKIIECVSSDLESEERNVAMAEIFGIADVWLHLISEAAKSEKVAIELIRLLAKLINANTAVGLMKRFLEDIFSRSCLVAILEKLCGKHVELVELFSKSCLKRVPQLKEKLAALSWRLVKHYFLGATHPREQQILDWFRIYLPLNPEEPSNRADITLSSDHIIPQSSQVVRGISNVIDLLPVRTNGPYQDWQDYLETYFRLTWAEAFSAVAKGIQAFNNGALDKRDMEVYFNVSLVGIERRMDQQVAFALKFTPGRSVKNWKHSTKLMFGNLLAISSMGQGFSKIIWAVVHERDEDLLNQESIIVVTLCENQGNAEAIKSMALNSGHMIMAESPTYFRALEPILRNLQRLSSEKYTLEMDIVLAQKVPTDVITEESDDIIRDTNKFTESMDESQRAAFDHALTSKIAIIQGPPGCGKTFLGVRIANFFVEAELGSPILVLTYKNHALDEFLKHTLKFCPKEKLVRIGGRSSEPALEECSIRNRVKPSKDSKRSLPSHLAFQFHSVREEINDLTPKILELCQSIIYVGRWSEKDILSLLKEQHLESLLCGQSWHTFKLSSKHKSLFAGPKFVQEWIAEAKANHGSLAQFVRAHSKLSEREVYLRGTLEHAFNKWRPTTKAVRDLSMLYSSKPQMPLSQAGNRKTAKEDDAIDEEDVLKMKALRNGGLASNKEPGDSLVMFGAREESDPVGMYDFSCFPEGCFADANLLDRNTDLWALNFMERIKFLATLSVCSNADMDEFSALVTRMEKLQQSLRDLKILEQYYAIQDACIVGATITGASISADLINMLSPEVVIVEEAGEILESALISALSNKTNRLIMIGDHKQLRPSVSDYDLVKNFHFDVSMMERLIMSGYPYKSLTRQSRMRPEFSALLKDIYPNLLDNEEVVCRNEPIKWIDKSIFFWCHEFPEDNLRTGDNDVLMGDGNRTKTNRKEAEMAMALALFMLAFGNAKPEEITILVSYLGQKKLFRDMLRQKAGEFPRLFPNGETIQCETIDMYQGDENKYVIVSLVRSEHLGFLKVKNRRCVAQSRAKCGLYFVGHANLFHSSPWLHIVKSLKEVDCYGPAMPLACPRHPTTKHLVKSVPEIMDFVANPEKLCSIQCGTEMPCKEHNCSLCCSSKGHKHDKCLAKVVRVLKKCEHQKTALCYEDVNRLKCEVKVEYQHKKCPYQHWLKKKCYVDEATLKCTKPCEFVYEDCKHTCGKKCGEPHKHGACEALIVTSFPDCGHNLPDKVCGETFERYSCNAIVTIKRLCGHDVTLKCHKVKTGNLGQCTSVCDQLLKCGDHKCPDECGSNHSHDVCNADVREKYPHCDHFTTRKCTKKITWVCSIKVEGKFPDCGHNLPDKVCGETFERYSCHASVTIKRSCGHDVTLECHKVKTGNLGICTSVCDQLLKCGDHKCPDECGSNHSHDVCKVDVREKYPHCDHFTTRKCTEKITWACAKEVKAKLKCGHKGSKLCYVKLDDVKCKTLCGKMISKCGHPCGNMCWQECQTDDCSACLASFKRSAEKKCQEIEAKIKSSSSTFEIETIDMKSPEFEDVVRQVDSTRLAMHNWNRSVTKIEKITNLELEAKFELAKSKAFGSYEVLKFHGTGLDGIQAIPKNGFRMPSKPGMYGMGIYFATNSSKSAQEIYTKNSGKLLFCKVLLGKAHRVDKHDNTLNAEKIRKLCCDSLFAPAGTKHTGGVANDEFVVYNPFQALPVYIIHFGHGHDNLIKALISTPTMKASSGQKVTKHTVSASRTMNPNDPFQEEFLKIYGEVSRKLNIQGQSRLLSLTKIDFVYNAELQRNFDAMQSEFRKKRLPVHTIFAYHGTDPKNIDSILENNLNKIDRTAFGHGYYFSEFPDVSRGYGNGMILFRLLPGNEYSGSSHHEHHGAKALYQSKKVTGNPDGFGQMMIIANNHQFIPYCVLHFS